ncbi:MAG: hypothetical protein JXB49_24625 [Bacteroidales bacterium]|nr:hypothetical protein [Bacteroidales bacterium]
MFQQSISNFNHCHIYAYDALELFIDKQTVEIHYSKHHK